jgi:hypothetical protein
MIPALFGNILGGSLCCGVYFWWMYLADVDDEHEPQDKGILSHPGHDIPSDEESQMESR